MCDALVVPPVPCLALKGSGLWGVSSVAEPASLQVLNAVENPQVQFIDRIVDDIFAGLQQLVECSPVQVVFRCSS